MQFFEDLKWDSDFFGYKVAQILNQDIDEQYFTETINYLKTQNYRLVYLKTEPENTKLNDFAKRNKIFLADKKVTFSIKFSEADNFSESNEIKDYKHDFVSDDLLKLAYQCGEFSRFKIDKNFKNREFEKLYQIWIEKSVKKEIAEKIFAYYIENSVSGMITLTKKNNIGIISLIGVDSNFRGQKIGQKLIEQTKNYFKQQNIFKIDVVTQLDNQTACNFYKKCGFKISKIENIYHLWM
jgi:dTDP-4-amino-4,6-dideoxy-D-galactose acyltransferase